MLDALKRLTKHSAIYGLGSLFQSLVGFILIPVYTRYLAPESYGRLEILNTILLILTMILSFGFASAILKVYERDCPTEKDKKSALGTMYLFVMPIATAATLLCAIFAKFLSPALLGEARYTIYIYIILATNLLAVFLTLSFALLRTKEKSRIFTFFSFSKFIFVLALNLYFVIKMRWGVFGILVGNLSAQIIIGLFFIPVILREIKLVFSKFLFSKLWLFGSAIIPASLASWIMDLADRYFLKHYTSMTEVGLYSLGYKIGMLVSMLLVIPFQLAWPTISFSAAAKNNVNEIYAKVLTYFTLAGSFFALFLSVFAKPIVKIFASPEYFLAYKIIPLIAFSYVLYGIHFVLVPGLHLREKSKYYPVIIGIPAAANLILNYLIIPKYGMIGAALTTFISFIFVVFLAYFITSRFYKVIYEWGRIIKIILVVCLILFLNYINKSDQLTFLILYNLLIFIAFPVILHCFRFFEKKEIAKIKKILGRLKWKM
ncbi:MAG: oligosaccharide flippase family protein [Patescibacteria group bacterium]